MLIIERSASRQFWHVLYGGTIVDCCYTKRQAEASLDVYKKILDMR